MHLDQKPGDRGLIQVRLTLGEIGPTERGLLSQALSSDRDLLVQSQWEPLDQLLLSRLAAAASAPLAASVSLLAFAGGPAAPTGVTPNPHLPQPPTVSTADPRAVLLLRRTLDLVALDVADSHTSWAETLAVWSRRAEAMGLRHVAAPGTAVTTGGTPDRSPQCGNTLLGAHQLWASTRVQPLRLMIDGDCLPPEPATGTHHVILELAAALARARPAAAVSLAVPVRSLASLRRRLQGCGVEVVERGKHTDRPHVIYRPFQMLEPSDLGWVRSTAERWVFSQLDMIGFSNSAYHPDPVMHRTSRNLQRAMLRHADGVTFISEFSRTTALVECPELDDRRCVVIPIGAPIGSRAEIPSVHPPVPPPFVLCLGPDFEHKNRPFALRVFAEMRRKGYTGSIVLAGHALHYGSTTGAEQELVRSWPADEQRMVHWVGPVDETAKWALLAAADAVLYPSVVEGFGLVPFEAAAVGTPTLAATGSAFEELTAGKGVVLADDWCPSGWADTVIGWNADRHAALEQAAAIRETGRAYTWEHAAARSWELFDYVVATPSRSAPFAGRDDGRRIDAVERLELGLTATGRADRLVRRVTRSGRRRLLGWRTTAQRRRGRSPD